MKYVAKVEDQTFAIEVGEDQITVDGRVHSADLRRIELLSLYSLLIDNLSHEVVIEERAGKYGAMLQGKLYTVEVQEERAWKQNLSSPEPPTAGNKTAVTAPMPSLVLEVHADVGQSKRSGEVLVVLESMKMRTELRCPQDSIVREVNVAPHDHVTHGQVLVSLAPQQGKDAD
jgi:propionyl-CoA carboxylase alpha chain